MNSLPELLQRYFLAFILVIALFIIFTYIVSMGLGILALFSTLEGLEFSRGSVMIYPLLFIAVEVNVNAGLYFLLLWWIFALCFAAAWKFRESLLTQITGFLSKTKGNPFSNNLLAMPLITSMLFVATLVLHFLQSQSGLPTGEPSFGDPFSAFLQFSRASVVEEILFRIIPIGAFLITYISIVGKSTRPYFSGIQRLKTCILAVLLPDKAKERVGLRTVGEGGLFGGGLTLAEWVMVAFTASLFGLAHYYGGWEIGKILPAALSGVVFGVAYLYYGVQAPILLHWFFNYYFTVFGLSSDFYFAEIDAMYSLTFLANLFLGVILWLSVAIFGLIALLGKFEKKTIPPGS